MKLLLPLPFPLTLLAVILAGSVSVTAAQEPCGRLTLDFDRFGETRGQYLTPQFYRDRMGIESVACRYINGRVGKCRIFDTNVPYGQWSFSRNGRCNCGPYPWPRLCQPWEKEACGDPDLGSYGRNLNNVLIIDECQDSCDPPDDIDTGGTFIFDFVKPVTIHEIGFMDTEECTRPTVSFYKSTGGRSVRAGPKTVNNGYSTRAYQEESVTRVEIDVFGSAAITSITFTAQECPFATQPSPVTASRAPPIVVGGTASIIDRGTSPTASTPTTTQNLPTPVSGTLPAQNCDAIMRVDCFTAGENGAPTFTSCQKHPIAEGDDCQVDAVLVYRLTNYGEVDLQVDSAEGTLNGERFDFTSSFDQSNPLSAKNCTVVQYPVVLDYCTSNKIEITGFVGASSVLTGGVCDAIARLAFTPRRIAPVTGTLPTTETPTTVSANGDPHIHRWNKDRYTFQGECDLVLVHSDQFHDVGLDLHLRTTIKDFYSFVEAVALRLGQHVLEFRKQGVVFDGIKLLDTELSLTFGEKYRYKINYRTELNRDKTRKKKFYMVQLGEHSSMELKFYRHFGSVEISGHPDDFGDSTGLSGTFPDGEMLGRDRRPMKKTDAFGFEWQVDPLTDPVLFAAVREPQLPNAKCRMPTVKKSSKTKLRGAAKALYRQAKIAWQCPDW